MTDQDKVMHKWLDKGYEIVNEQSDGTLVLKKGRCSVHLVYIETDGTEHA